MKYKKEDVLPKFVRTMHLPIEPNAERDDLIASEKELNDLMDNENVFVEEKVDGANCGIRLNDSKQ